MTTKLAELEAWDAETGLLNVVVDTPRGSRNKYKYDEDEGLWRLGKVLPLGACFPYDFGFIPSTRGGDGDPLDILVLTEAPSFPGCVLPVRLIGVLKGEQIEDDQQERNDRLLGVIDTEHNPPAFRSAEEIEGQRIAEIEHFFKSYNEMEGRRFRSLGCFGPECAVRIIEEGIERHGGRGPSSHRHSRNGHGSLA